MIEFEGKVWKDPDSSWWLAEIFFLDVMAQGKTRKEALEMLKDAVKELIKDSFKISNRKKLNLKIHLYENQMIGLGASDNTLIFSLGLKRQRMISGSSIREVSKRLNSKHPNSYARYEKAQAKPSLEKCAQLLHAVNPSRRPLLVG